jgi:hypothetical protein
MRRTTSLTSSSLRPRRVPATLVASEQLTRHVAQLNLSLSATTDASTRREHTREVTRLVEHAARRDAPLMSLEARLVATDFALAALLAADDAREAALLFGHTVALLRGLRSLPVDSFLVVWNLRLSTVSFPLQPQLQQQLVSSSVLPPALAWSPESAARLRAADALLDRYFNTPTRSLAAATDLCALVARAVSVFQEIGAPESALLLALRVVEWFTKCTNLSDALDRQRTALLAHVRHVLRDHAPLLALLDDTDDFHARRLHDVVQRDRVYRSLANGSSSSISSIVDNNTRIGDDAPELRAAVQQLLHSKPARRGGGGGVAKR